MMWAVHAGERFLTAPRYSRRYVHTTNKLRHVRQAQHLSLNNVSLYDGHTLGWTMEDGPTDVDIYYWFMYSGMSIWSWLTTFPRLWIAKESLYTMSAIGRWLEGQEYPRQYRMQVHASLFKKKYSKKHANLQKNNVCEN